MSSTGAQDHPHLCCWLISCELVIPTTSSSGSVNLLEWLTELRETVTYIYQFIIKDKNEQPDKEVQRAGSQRVPGAGAPVPMELGYPIPISQHVDVFTNPGAP